ncbi:MAG TPA: nitrilase-related carbon-nitrogen hydrolase [Terriglobales bacterium]
MAQPNEALRRSQTAATRVALVQMRCGAEPEANLANAIARVREAAEQGAKIICLPELFRSQYFCQSEDHANFSKLRFIPFGRTLLAWQAL